MYTPNRNSQLGVLGILGFLGFTGFFPELFQLTEQIPVPSFFFGFFVFFGFYYEGKMANTLMDERFLFNKHRAEALANKIALTIIIFFTCISFAIANRATSYDALSLLIAAIGISFGLSIFLGQYFLYKFENEE